MKVVYVIERRDTQQWLTAGIGDWTSNIHDAIQWDKREDAEWNLYEDWKDWNVLKDIQVYVTEHQIG